MNAENDLLAQALEHEIDHLNGIMYTDHLVAHTTLYKAREAGEGEGEEGSEEPSDEPERNGAEHHHPDPAFDALHRRLHAMNLDEGQSAEGDQPAGA